MKILTFAASNSRNSINRALVDHAVIQLRDKVGANALIETLDIDDYEMPIYSIDREHEDGVPALAQDFYARIGEADAILVSFAEHNGSVTAAWKNLFDWMSRIDSKVWQGKPMVMLAASPGARAGASVLASQQLLAPHFGADLRGTLGVGRWTEAWDAEEATLIRADDAEALDDVLSQLLQAID